MKRSNSTLTPGLRTPLILLCVCVIALGACVWPRGQRFSDFSVATPTEPGQYLILGFLGGRNRWNDETQGVRKLALRLRKMDLPAQVETVENTKRKLALRLIRRALDRNVDGRLDRREKAAARLILYGQSFGGAAVVKLARQLEKLEIPVELTVQIDSVGLGDGRIPANVEEALNLYQTDGWIIQGQANVRAEDPSQTEVTNRRFRYRGKPVDISDVHWFKKLFRVAHTKMGLDPEVWSLVEAVILETIGESDGLPGS